MFSDLFRRFFALNFLSFCFVLGLFACGGRNDFTPGRNRIYSDFAASISGRLVKYDSGAVVIGIADSTLSSAYSKHHNFPFWISEDGSCRPYSFSLLEELESLRWDGADSTLYQVDSIRMALIRLDTTVEKDIKEIVRLDTTLTKAYLTASRFLLLGRFSPHSLDRSWFHRNDTVWDAVNSLAYADSSYPELNSYRSTFPAYKLMLEEYKRKSLLQKDTSYINAVFNVGKPNQIDSVFRLSTHYIMQSALPHLSIIHNDTVTDLEQLITAYQYYYGLRVTRKLDESTIKSLLVPPTERCRKLLINLERIRWMPRNIGNTHIIVDIPLTEMFLTRTDTNVMNMRVVVGKTARQTPSIFAEITYIVVNPTWTVPPTILKNDVFPGVLNGGQSYLSKKGLKIYDKKGNSVDPNTITRKNYRLYTYRQAPGHSNSLGYIKFNMPNKWDIYLHDTPHRDDFGNYYRALSSGCVRLQKPKDLALYVLSDMEGRATYTPGRLDSIIDTHKTKWLRLENKIPVYVAYLTVFQDSTGKAIRYANDIYKRDDRIEDAFFGQKIDTNSNGFIVY